MFTIRTLIRDFVTAQSALLRIFSKNREGRSGKIVFNGVNWKWQKHGAGVAFTNLSNGVVVDAHKHIDKPNYIDAWRLAYYMETHGTTEILVNDVVQSIDSYRDLRTILDKLCEPNFLSPIGNNHFEVSILSIVDEAKHC